MIQRSFVTILFFTLGIASLLIWAAIDSRLCDEITNLCNPPAGYCGGIDGCPASVKMSVRIALTVATPPSLFAIVGYALDKRNARVKTYALTLMFLIVFHWALTFLGTRLAAL